MIAPSPTNTPSPVAAARSTATEARLAYRRQQRRPTWGFCRRNRSTPAHWTDMRGGLRASVERAGVVARALRGVQRQAIDVGVRAGESSADAGEPPRDAAGEYIGEDTLDALGEMRGSASAGLCVCASANGAIQG
eukprot:CAMPEP_0115842714 /NCGR_PEP_ID=MMETSP0287-20121206/7941_1 /TAXON_ID=412157 /ORGANISM="Chrysochromulina rotalis, Strain UIO044" /LENGTH=134 /DNA_ID=CAMNT_0003296389 /DNA_START=192 /DNA_END=597 /DNA_ORIENTATION=-